MTIHERLKAFWAGEKPDRIPFTIYSHLWKNCQDDPAWDRLYEAGLGVTHHYCPYDEEVDPDISFHREISEDQSRKKAIWSTPVGDVCRESEDGWCSKHFIESAADYEVMTYIVRNTSLTPCYEEMEENIEKIKPYGVPLILIGRTPLQTILVDYVGLENFAYHLMDYEDEIWELYDALYDQFRRRVEIAADAPGRFVANLENFTAESLGPKRYEKFLLPVYEECFPLLHEAGKVVGCHYDGRTRCCKDAIRQSPIDTIESLTEPHEGDMTLPEARDAWPEKLFWCNIRVGDYQLPPDELKDRVVSMVEEGSVDGRQFALEVSEDLPGNWRESLPVVLEALNGMAGK